LSANRAYSVQLWLLRQPHLLLNLKNLQTMKQTKKSSDENKNGKQQTGNNKQASNSNGSQHQESLLEKFFIDQLKDIYYAEQQLLKALPEMQKACTTEELEDAFGDHLKQTERHVKRLERVFQAVGKKAEGKKCEAMDGLIKEARSIISETKEGTMTRDAALIIAAQKVEHYEIATYGTRTTGYYDES